MLKQRRGVFQTTKCQVQTTWDLDEMLSVASTQQFTQDIWIHHKSRHTTYLLQLITPWAAVSLGEDWAWNGRKTGWKTLQVSLSLFKPLHLLMVVITSVSYHINLEVRLIGSCMLGLSDHTEWHYCSTDLKGSLSWSSLSLKRLTYRVECVEW